MADIVVYDFASIIARYPEFAPVGTDLMEQYWNEGTQYLRNDGTSLVTQTATQARLLNMLAAHIAWLNAPRDAAGNPAASGQPASPLVGTITDAAEGSVNVSVQNDFPPGTAQWFQQTKYGAAYWAATAVYRTMRYRVPVPAGPVTNPWPIGSPGWYRFNSGGFIY